MLCRWQVLQYVGDLLANIQPISEFVILGFFVVSIHSNVLLWKPIRKLKLAKQACEEKELWWEGQKKAEGGTQYIAIERFLSGPGVQITVNVCMVRCSNRVSYDVSHLFAAAPR